nr:hypothetical protein [uncultured Oscillibacter sp.]
MHTLLLVFSLRFGMADFADRMRRLCWVLERGLPSAPGITVSMVYHKPKKSIFFQGADIRVFVDCLSHLGKTNMAPSDIPIIRAAILDVIAPLGISMEELALESIDYCQNVVVMDPEERRLAMRLWHKTSRHFLKAERMDPKHSENENRLYYKCRDDFYRVQLYNKQTEREDKGLDTASYELGVLRLEYQLRRDHLLYHWQRYGTPCSFDAWADWSLRAAYLRQTERLFFRGDFYTLRRAETLLRKAGLPSKDFQGIRQFMTNISKSGIDYAVRQAGSRYLANKYTNTLTDLGICPIPIPQNARTPFLENPFREFYERDCR